MSESMSESMSSSTCRPPSLPSLLTQIRYFLFSAFSHSLRPSYSLQSKRIISYSLPSSISDFLGTSNFLIPYTSYPLRSSVSYSIRSLFSLCILFVPLLLYFRSTSVVFVLIVSILLVIFFPIPIVLLFLIAFLLYFVILLLLLHFHSSFLSPSFSSSAFRSLGKNQRISEIPRACMHPPASSRH